MFIINRDEPKGHQQSNVCDVDNNKEKIYSLSER